MTVRQWADIAYSGKYQNAAYGVERTLTYTNSGRMEGMTHSKPYGRVSGDNGGPWRLEKTSYSVTPAVFPQWTYLAPGQFYYGPVVPGAGTGGWLQTVTNGSPKTEGEMSALGTTLVSRALPNNPAFSLSTFLGEMKEGFPSIVGSSTLKDRTHFLRNSGNEYLNLEFGWKPLVSELRSFAHAVKHSEKIMNSYRKGSDKKIRRERRFQDKVSEQKYTGNLFPVPSDFNQFGTGSISITKTDKTWFSGAFRYHIPVTDTVAGDMARFSSYANVLLGVKLTPSVLWELTPWSWAVDWFTNTGDIMNNISLLGQDGMVMEYGYVMCSSEYEDDRKGVFLGKHCSLNKKHAVKQRFPATPYGFGVDMTKLSTRQVAVLAALGLSKVG